MELKSLDDWKKYFRSANTSIYTIIDNAIRVAASEDPNEFKVRRGEIVEKIYSCAITKCCCNDDLKLESREKECKSTGGNCNDLVVSDDEPRSPSNEERVCGGEVSKYNSREVEALTDTMEEHSANIRNILRIKESLENSQHQTEAEITESLRKLQLMVLTVQVLEETSIGETVFKLVKHGCSKQIRQLAETTLTSWMAMMREYVKFTNNLEEVQSKDPNSSLGDDDAGGLPIPPMDEGVFFLSHQPPMELSEFFNDIDDNGNPEDSHGAEKIHESKSSVPREHKRELDLQPSDNNDQSKRAKKEPLEKMSKPMDEERSDPLAEIKRNLTSKLNEGTTSVSTSRRQNSKQESIEKSAKPRYYIPSGSENAWKRLEQQQLLIEAENKRGVQKKMDKDRVLQSPEAAEKNPADAQAAKLEMTKRKLRQGYQEAHKARRNTKMIVDVPEERGNRAFSRRKSGWNCKPQNSTKAPITVKEKK